MAYGSCSIVDSGVFTPMKRTFSSVPSGIVTWIVSPSTLLETRTSIRPVTERVPVASTEPDEVATAEPPDTPPGTPGEGSAATPHPRSAATDTARTTMTSVALTRTLRMARSTPSADGTTLQVGSDIRRNHWRR